MGGTQAATFIDDFESYSPVFGDMNGQGGWTVSNGTPADSGEGPVAMVDDYTWNGPGQSATLGGIAQTTLGITSLSHAVDVSLAGTVGTPSSYKFETAFTDSVIGDFRNSFKFVLSSTSGNLLTIDLTPGDAGKQTVSWSSAFATGGILGIASANVPTQFQLNTWWNGSAMQYAFSNAGNPVSSGTLAGIDSSESLTGFAVNWDSTGGAGGNYITVDNVSLVPEPSSALLIGLAGLGFISRRRRA